MANGSGWNLWVWLVGGGCGWNLWVWLVGVVYRFPHNYYLSLLLLYLFFFSSIPIFIFFYFIFSFLVPVHFVITFNVLP